jgi:hypothetical protein
MAAEGRRKPGRQAKVARFSTTVCNGCTCQPSARACATTWPSSVALSAVLALTTKASSPAGPPS